MKLPRKSASVFAGIWIVSVALAFLIGFWISRAVLDNALADMEKDSMNGDTEVAERAVIIRKLTGQAPASTPGTTFAPQAREALAKALTEKDPEKRAYAMKVILSGLALTDIGEAVSLVEGLVPGPRQDELMGAMLRRWAELDGRSALAYALENTAGWQQEGALVATLEGWVKREPQTALNWALENPGTDPFYSERLNAVIRQLAITDPRRAFDAAASIEQGSYRASALSVVMDELFETGRFEGSLSWIDDLPDTMDQSVAVEHLARRWSRYEPVLAAEWVESLSGQPGQQSALAAVSATWAAVDPQRAADWASRLVEGPDRAGSVTTVVETWLQSGDLGEAAEWLNSQPSHPDFDQAVTKVAIATLQVDPETAMTWADSITDDNLRNTTMTMVGNLWMSEDPQGAQAYYDATGAAPPANTLVFSEPGVKIFRGQTMSFSSAPGYQQGTITVQPVDGAQGSIPAADVIVVPDDAVVDFVVPEDGAEE